MIDFVKKLLFTRIFDDFCCAFIELEFCGDDTAVTTLFTNKNGSKKQRLTHFRQRKSFFVHHKVSWQCDKVGGKFSKVLDFSRTLNSPPKSTPDNVSYFFTSPSSFYPKQIRCD